MKRKTALLSVALLSAATVASAQTGFQAWMTTEGAGVVVSGGVPGNYYPVYGPAYGVPYGPSHHYHGKKAKKQYKKVKKAQKKYLKAREKYFKEMRKASRHRHHHHDD